MINLVLQGLSVYLVITFLRSLICTYIASTFDFTSNESIEALFKQDADHGEQYAMGANVRLAFAQS